MKGRIDTFLDGVLAAPGNPRGPIGEPVEAQWALIFRALAQGYEVNCLTWREPSQVYQWLQDAKLMRTVERFRFRVLNAIPVGIPTFLMAPSVMSERDRVIQFGET